MKILKAKIIIIIAALAAFGLVGCAIYPEDYYVATFTCEKNGGVEYVETSQLGASIFIKCKNGGNFLKTR